MDASHTPTDVYRAWLMVQQAGQVLQAAADVRLRALGLNLHRAAALIVLRTHGPQPMSVLARYLLLQTQTMTDTIDRLEAAGLVDRLRHPTDRRIVQVSITEAGATAAASADAALMEIATMTFGTLPDDEVASIAALLPGIRDAVAPVAGIPTDHFTYATETLALSGPPAA